MDTPKAVVAIYETHGDAEAAIRTLQTAGFDMKTLSIVGRDFLSDEQVLGGDNTGERMKPWGKLWAFWGGMWELLAGRGFFVVPDIGPVLVAGPLVDVLGIPTNTVPDYALALRSGRFLLVAHGSVEKVARAKDILTTAVVTPALHD